MKICRLSLSNSIIKLKVVPMSCMNEKAFWTVPLKVQSKLNDLRRPKMPCVLLHYHNSCYDGISHCPKKCPIYPCMCQVGRPASFRCALFPSGPLYPTIVSIVLLRKTLTSCCLKQHSTATAKQTAQNTIMLSYRCDWFRFWMEYFVPSSKT